MQVETGPKTGRELLQDLGVPLVGYSFPGHEIFSRRIDAVKVLSGEFEKAGEILRCMNWQHFPQEGGKSIYTVDTKRSVLPRIVWIKLGRAFYAGYFRTKAREIGINKFRKWSKTDEGRMRTRGLEFAGKSA